MLRARVFRTNGIELGRIALGTVQFMSSTRHPPVQKIARIESEKKTDSYLRTSRPKTPGTRHLRRAIHPFLWKGKPYRPLTVAKRKTGGRNNTGRITVRHRGGGHRQRLRLVDFRRLETGVQTIERIEYDPCRTAHIALLVHNQTGKHSYILAPEGLRAGHTVESFLGEDLDSEDRGLLAARTIKTGNCLPLSHIPVGTVVHAIGMTAGGPAKLARSAGTHAQVLQTKFTDYAIVRLSSGETRRVPAKACATVGVVSNELHKLERHGKAGRRRWLGWRPQVRGIAMNAVDHPHGGGRGKGNKHPRSPWGWLTKGKKTRSRVSQFVVTPRPRGKKHKRRS